MPWFDPIASDVEIAAWISPSGTGSKHIVGRWPHPNTLRTSSDYIFKHTDDLSHVAFRRLFKLVLDDTTDADMWPEEERAGWFDLAVFQQGWILATSDVNDLGWQMDMSIQQALVLPVFGTPGVQVRMKAEHLATGHFVDQTWEYQLDPNPWRYDRDQAPDFLAHETDDRSVGFPYLKPFQFDWAMSDCFLFPRAEAAPLDFAEFNGVDSRIVFDQFTNAHNQRFRLVCDIRLYNTNLGIILGRTNNTTRWVGIRPHNIQWRSGVINFSPDLPLEEWGTLRVDHNWVDGPTSGWKVYWNDVLIGTAGAGVSELPFNSMGYRANSYGSNFDMRLLTLEDTDPGAPRLLISTELQVNACDIGEKMMIGTTENMTLSSCPP